MGLYVDIVLVTLRLYGFCLQGAVVMTNAYILREYFTAGMRRYLLRYSAIEYNTPP